MIIRPDRDPFSASKPPPKSAHFRPPSYYYDQELGLYYLKSRYYDPEVCRFINADDTANLGADDTILSHNLYAYCGNNPVKRVDDGGNLWNFIIGAVVGAAVGAISAIVEGKSTSEVLVAAGVGAVCGVISASGLAVVGQAFACAAVSAAGEATNQTIAMVEEGNWTLEGYNYAAIAKEGIKGGVTSILGSAGGRLIGKYGTKTIPKAEEAFTSYLEKSFVAGIRSEAGKSSSALLRQAAKYSAQVTFWDNTTKGVSSCFGSIVTFAGEFFW